MISALISLMSAPSHLLFIDTNIPINTHDRSTGDRHILARNRIRALWQSARGRLRIQAMHDSM